jgi:16S rRNA (adenine1518-N6/adenine1519-N6)-dimethyltransferase
MGIRQKLRELDFRIKKRLGQNFLQDEETLDSILTQADLRSDEVVLEIGAGLGDLTERLADTAERVIALELDPLLHSYLSDRFKHRGNIRILHQDILKYEMEDLPERGVKVVANLPYYISTPILLHLIQSIHRFSLILIMLQKEVAERITAKPGNKRYGSLSIVCQYHTDAEIVIRVPKSAFYPMPEVDSAMVRMIVREKPPIDVSNPEEFFRLVRMAFSQRRKTLRNSLLGTGTFSPEELDRAFTVTGILPARRAETLSMDEFAALSHVLHSSL